MNEDKYSDYKRAKEKHKAYFDELCRGNTSIQSKLKLKGREKIYFHLWFCLKNPIILLHVVVSLAIIAIAIIQKWQYETVLAIFSIGIIAVLLEDIITVLLVKKFRTKYYKSNGSEMTSKTHSKVEILQKVILSGVITSVLLYFVNDEDIITNWHELKDFWPAIIYALTLLCISVVRVLYLTQRTEQAYDLSITMGRRIFQPIGLLLLLWLTFGLSVFSSTIGSVIFLIIYAVIRYFGAVFSSFMSLNDAEEAKLEAELQSFIQKIRKREIIDE